ncbi:MAG TPA: NAD(P)-binding domain-containing protein, partial [Phycisphaerae bacterium]|nr:NAD(P)-binding domain-containing protein [Phycisphaerae bacterium]
GLSVTIPHKENALEYIRQKSGGVDPTSKAIGAVNTIFFNCNPIQAINSDWAGAIKAMEVIGGIKSKDFKQRSAAVLGAGGAARSIVAGLASLGAKVCIYNRTVDRARALAQQFNGKSGVVQAAPLDEIANAKFDLLINCTSVGMYPDSNGLPIPENMNLGQGQIVFDTIYNPRQTRLLKLAQSRGATTIPGLEMLLHQAELQFAGFCKTKAPMDVMHTAAESALTAMGQ